MADARHDDMSWLSEFLRNLPWTDGQSHLAEFQRQDAERQRAEDERHFRSTGRRPRRRLDDPLADDFFSRFLNESEQRAVEDLQQRHDSSESNSSVSPGAEIQENLAKVAEIQKQEKLRKEAEKKFSNPITGIDFD